VIFGCQRQVRPADFPARKVLLGLLITPGFLRTFEVARACDSLMECPNSSFSGYDLFTNLENVMGGDFRMGSHFVEYL
jgi:hypothetical protein